MTQVAHTARPSGSRVVTARSCPHRPHRSTRRRCAHTLQARCPSSRCVNQSRRPQLTHTGPAIPVAPATISSATSRSITAGADVDARNTSTPTNASTSQPACRHVGAARPTAANTAVSSRSSSHEHNVAVAVRCSAVVRSIARRRAVQVPHNAAPVSDLVDTGRSAPHPSHGWSPARARQVPQRPPRSCSPDRAHTVHAGSVTGQ